MIRIRRGTSLLNKVVKQFDRAVADLEVASEQIEAKRQKAIAKMTARTEKHQQELAQLRVEYAAEQGRLATEENELYYARRRAQAVANNIAKLVNA